MGNKVNPKIFRIGITQDWQSKWFAKKDYGQNLELDVKIRKYLKDRLKDAGLAAILIERSGANIKVNISTSKPGIVIGRGGSGAENLRKELKDKVIKDKKISVNLNIQEVQKPNLNGQIVCQGMIEQIEKRIPFRRILRGTLDQVMKAGAKGVKVNVAGRLNGAEIARTEKLAIGCIPLHTLRADIDFAQGTAATTYGSIGVKVWIYKGEIFKKEKNSLNPEPEKK
ncbi:MAG: 30S ribosomal protein S3 [Patescibacteria group bacterium]